MQDLWVGVFQESAHLGQSLKGNTWSEVRHRHTTFYVPQPSISLDPRPCRPRPPFSSLSFSSSSFCFLFILLLHVAEACWQPLSPCLWMSAAKEIGAGLMKLAVETLLPKPKPPKAVVPLRSRKKKKKSRHSKMHKDCAMPPHCHVIAKILPRRCHAIPRLPCHWHIAMLLPWSQALHIVIAASLPCCQGQG